MNEEKIICAACGAEIDEGDTSYELPSGDVICEDCYENDYTVCNDCGDVVLTSDTISVNDGNLIVCEPCAEGNEGYYHCNCCDEWFTTDYRRVYELHNLALVCADCADDECVECAECGDLFYRYEMTEDEDNYGDSIYYCADCERYRKKKAIHQYSYKPEPKYKTHHSHDEFWTDSSIKELLFGVELEIDKGEDPEAVAESITGACEDVYCKHDGSLSAGVEIVSHPCTLEYHLKDLGWDNICNIALDAGFLSHKARTCGLHIHVGRRQLGANDRIRREVISRIVMLVQRHWNNIFLFSRRDASQVHWAAKPCVDTSAMTLENAHSFVYSAISSAGRYQAVNLSNSNTIEFRIYNGTLKASTLYATLQFTSNICKYAMSHTLEECLASQWLDVALCEGIPELALYLADKHLDSVPDIAPLKLADELVIHGGYKIGDRVRVINADGGGVTSLQSRIGVEATVAAFPDNIDFDIGLDFGTPSLDLHDLAGKITSNSGYWVFFRNIERISA